MPRDGEVTRQRILDAAEQVIADVGVDAATFAEINARAAQRNNSAAQYHFGDRVALLEAVIRRHAEAIAVRRAEMVAALGPDADLAAVVRSLIEPLADCLGSASGRRYLIIQASLLSHPDRDTWSDHLARPWTRPGLGEVADRVAAAVDGGGDESIDDFKREMVSLLVFHTLAAQARRTTPGYEPSAYVSALVRATVALIEADL